MRSYATAEFELGFELRRVEKRNRELRDRVRDLEAERARLLELVGRQYRTIDELELELVQTRARRC